MLVTFDLEWWENLEEFTIADISTDFEQGLILDISH